MKNFTLFMILICLATPAMADDNVTIVQGGGERQIIELPGNATISTGGAGNPSGVLIRGDDDIARTMLLGPRVRYYGGAPSQGIGITCPVNLSTRERQKCIKDVVEAQEKIRKKYND